MGLLCNCLVGAAGAPRGCARNQGAGGEAGSVLYRVVGTDVDDALPVEVRLSKGGRRCIRALQSLSSDHYRPLGKRDPDDPTAVFREPPPPPVGFPGWKVWDGSSTQTIFQ